MYTLDKQKYITEYARIEYIQKSAVVNIQR